MGEWPYGLVCVGGRGGLWVGLCLVSESGWVLGGSTARHRTARRSESSRPQTPPDANVVSVVALSCSTPLTAVVAFVVRDRVMINVRYSPRWLFPMHTFKHLGQPVRTQPPTLTSETPPRYIGLQSPFNFF